MRRLIPHIVEGWYACAWGRNFLRCRGWFWGLMLIPRRDLTGEGEITLAALTVRIETHPIRISVTSHAGAIADRVAYLAGQDVLAVPPPSGVDGGWGR